MNNRIADKTDWICYQFAPQDGVRFEIFHVESPDDNRINAHANPESLYELVLHRPPRNPNDKPSQYPSQAIFQRHPDKDIYHTKDLFKRHPAAKDKHSHKHQHDLWSYSCRTSDFISLSNLAKINTSALENIIARHPTIEAVIVDGSGRDKPFAIVQMIEPEPDSEASSYDEIETPEENLPVTVESSKAKREQLIDIIWDAFEEANGTVSDKRKRVCRHKIIIAPKSKPITMPRPIETGTDTNIDRKKTLENFAEEIERMYRQSQICCGPSVVCSNCN